MRISVDETDSGYVNPELRPYIHIFLDGQVQNHVLTADEGLGRLVRYKQDGVGNMILVGGALVEEILTGVVRVVSVGPQEFKPVAPTSRSGGM